MFRNLVKLFLILVVASSSIASNQESTLEHGDHFQGDIVLSDEQESIINGDLNHGRTGWTLAQYLWPKSSDGFVKVPFVINVGTGYTASDVNIIRNGQRAIEETTCIRFIPRTDEEDYVEYINGQGCYSSLGRQGGKQQISLQRNGCVNQRSPTHESIHALGYDHMHNSVDRDQYVQINLENVDPDKQHNFNPVDPRFFSNYGTAYDLLSIMHYPRQAFSDNGKDTIVPRDPNYLDRIGAKVMSSGDIQRIRNMYKC